LKTGVNKGLSNKSNDTVPIYGETAKTDSTRNILSNKLSAIFRYAAKDIADIREIALHETIDWAAIIQEVRQKEAGLELTYVSEILPGMPKSEFETITWVKKPEWNVFCGDIERIVFEMMNE